MLAVRAHGLLPIAILGNTVIMSTIFGIHDDFFSTQSRFLIFSGYFFSQVVKSAMAKTRPQDPGFGERLRFLSELVGGGNALASIASVSRSSLTLWLGGKRPNEATIERIAARTNVSVKWLSEGLGPEPAPTSVQKGTVAGTPIPTLSPGVRAFPAISREWIDAVWPGIEVENLSFWVMPDDSMAPTIRALDPILIYLIPTRDEDAYEATVAWVSSGDSLALVEYEGRDRLIRRVVLDGNRLIFKAEAEGFRDLMGYPSEILGVVLWAGRKLRG